MQMDNFVWMNPKALRSWW